MGEKAEIKIDYIAYESALARMERVNNRLLCLCIAVFAALFITNAGWIWYENQFEDTVTVTQETPTGNNNYVGHDGNITNGEANNH